MSEIFEDVMTLLQSPAAKKLSPRERIDIVSVARSALRVPATIWSPADFEGYIPADVEDRQALAVEMWENYDTETTEEEWERVAFYASMYLDEME